LLIGKLNAGGGYGVVAIANDFQRLPVTLLLRYTRDRTVTKKSPGEMPGDFHLQTV
jgi:hypothetical protein